MIVNLRRPGEIKSITYLFSFFFMLDWMNGPKRYLRNKVESLDLAAGLCLKGPRIGVRMEKEKL